MIRELGMYIQDIFPILDKSQLCAEDDPLALSILRWNGIFDRSVNADDTADTMKS